MFHEQAPPTDSSSNSTPKYIINNKKTCKQNQNQRMSQMQQLEFLPSRFFRRVVPRSSQKLLGYAPSVGKGTGWKAYASVAAAPCFG